MFCFCKFDEAFCGCSLRTVSQFILYVSLALSFAHLIGNVYSSPTSPEKLTYLQNSVADGFTAFGVEEDEAEIRAVQWVYWYKISAMSVMLNNVISIVVTMIAVYGLHENKPLLMLPYLFVRMIDFGIFGIMVILLGALVFIAPKCFVFFLFAALVYGLNYYLYLIVYNYYRVLKEIIYSAGAVKYVI